MVQDSGLCKGVQCSAVSMAVEYMYGKRRGTVRRVQRCVGRRWVVWCDSDAASMLLLLLIVLGCLVRLSRDWCLGSVMRCVGRTVWNVREAAPNQRIKGAMCDMSE